MKRQLSIYRFIVAMGFLCLPGIWAHSAHSQEIEGEPAPADITTSDKEDLNAATTIEDPTIPIDQLKLLVKPLNLEELEIEAAAWMVLLKEKVRAVSETELAIKRKIQSLDAERAAINAVEAAMSDLATAEEAQSGAEPNSAEHEVAVKKVEEARSTLRKAEDRIEEALESVVKSEQDSTVIEARRESAEGEAQKVLEQARKDREGMTAGSALYEAATQKIERLEEELSELEKAKEEEKKTVPDSPENEAASRKIAQGRAAVEQARAAITGESRKDDSAEAADPEKELKETASEIENVEKQADDTATDKANIIQKERQLASTALKLEEISKSEVELKNQMVSDVTELQSERTAVVDRFSVVLDELERKGGDASVYRKFIQAVSVIELDFQDTEGLGVRIKGWLLADEGGMRWLGNIGKFIGILAVSIILALILGMIFHRLLTRAGVSEMFRDFLVVLIRRGGAVAGFLVGLTALEVSLGPILALVGGASFVLAFALQSKIGNFASGLMLLIHRPFDVGDEIKVAGYWAFVEKISLANTKIKDFNNNLITLPNNTVWESEIINYTHSDIRVLSFPVHVKFSQDLDEVYEMWMEIASSHPKVLESPEPEWFPWNEYFDYYIFVELMASVPTEDFWDVYVDLLKELQRKIGDLNIELTAPQQDVNLHDSPAPPLLKKGSLARSN